MAFSPGLGTRFRSQHCGSRDTQYHTGVVFGEDVSFTVSLEGSFVIVITAKTWVRPVKTSELCGIMDMTII